MSATTESWFEVELGDLVEVEHGWPFKGKLCDERLTGKPIVVNIGNFRYDGGFRFETTRVREYRGEYPHEYELDPNDILLVMTCQTPGGEILGIPARVPDDGRVYLHNQRLGKVVVKQSDCVFENFLYWLFQWPEFNRELYSSASGTKILHTSPTRIKNFRFQLPPMAVQKAIARILGSLDDKIELNREMNRTLEATAQALFRSWFVDFDPVVAKADGRKPFGMSDDLAALFPDRFVESDLGPIPEGWGVTQIDALLHMERSSVKPQEHPSEIFDHYSIPAFDNGRQPVREPGANIRSNKYLIPGGAVLLSKLNPETSRVWNPSAEGKARRICSTEFLVCLPRPPYGEAFLSSLFKSPEFQGEFASLVTGTSKSHQRARPKDFQRMKVVAPHRDLALAFDEIASPILTKTVKARVESQSLAALRDLLLPKLLSGEIRVGEAENAVEAAV